MGNFNEGPFPHGVTLKKFEGTIYKTEDMDFRLTKIQKELYQAMGVSRRQATFDAENVQTGEPVIMKIWAEYNNIPMLQHKFAAIV
ncbi:hypothetical protein PHISCL_05762 [Aspergillus sclerotialis]|uniref:Uncharacterized protein n=1 Tax=Aspergillus sclerotialis TaxID=2070753 RepID=A0A3A2ZKJ8_9EURO|nr:hypothetical protein PHISCL_05762 [Aspergillus sclerotialis]